MSKKEKVNKEPSRCRSTFYFEGKQYETTGKTQKEAEKKAAIKHDKLKRGEIGISGDMKVSSWAKEWLKTFIKPKATDAHYKSYELFIGIVVSEVGNIKMKNIKDIDLQNILNKNEGMSKSYLTKLRMYTKKMFKRAQKSRVILYNPAEDLEMPAAVEKTRRSITDYEREHILTLAETHRGGLWIKTMLYCGLRPGEIRALKWEHIVLKKKLIKVEEAVKSKSKEIGTPKSNSGIRCVPIPDHLMEEFIRIKGEPKSPVFPQTVAKGYHTETSFRRIWNSFIRQMDINMGAKLYRNKIVESKVADDLCPYCLRHTYCTDLELAGVPINIAKYLMGHSDITLTSKTYTHTSEEIVKNAAEMINNYEKAGKNAIMENIMEKVS